MARYQVYDLEAGTKSAFKRKATQFGGLNYIVAGGWKCQGDERASWQYVKRGEPAFQLHIPEDVLVLVGFNIKYDLLWQWDNPELIAFFKRGGWVWDCQYVEYLLQAQHPRAQMCSMDSIVEKYGGRKKIDAIKLLWKLGVDTPDIQEDMLIDYLVGTEEEGRDSGDIGNTEKIFIGQLAKAKELGMLTSIRRRMDGLCATTEMEWNGLLVDTEEAKRRLLVLEQDFLAASEDLEQYIPELPDGCEGDYQ